MTQTYHVQMVIQMTSMVRRILITNAVVWVVGVLLVQQMVFGGRPLVFDWLGLSPQHLVGDYFLWQPLTYMFVHDVGLFHILFNGLVLWFIGSELEQRWGSAFFLRFYLGTGILAAVFYATGVYVYVLLSGHPEPLIVPVVGASGALFGLLLAYGWLFGERVVLFMLLFPMKARYFVMLLGGIEFFSLVSASSNPWTNFIHLCGLPAGFLMLWSSIWKWPPGRSWRSQAARRRLRLVVDNEGAKIEEVRGNSDPRYWN